MKTISATAIVALMTATFGLSAIAPAFAQDAAPTAAPQQQVQNFRHNNNNDGGPRQGGVGNFLNFERGAEAVEVAFVRLSHAIDLTAEQQPLFDAFKTAALTAATDLETTLESLRPAAPVEGETATVTMPDISERLENRIAVDKARLAALEAVQPSAAAFFDSLTDEQKSALMPQRPDHNGGPGFGKGFPGGEGQWGGQHHGGPGGHGPDGHGPDGMNGMAPPPAHAPAPADAPAAAPADAPAAING